MRARGWVAAALLVSSIAGASPKPLPIDIKPYRDRLQVFQDAKGGIYVVLAQTGEQVVFYGTGKTLYEQRVVGYSANGEAHTWSIGTDAPRLAQLQHGYIAKMPDGTVQRQCDGKDDAVLSELIGDKAKAVLDKSQFLTTTMFYVSVLIARDDSGVYYYVDRLAKIYGGKGFRVWVGKKGAMKEMPLTDVASDSAGQVFSTKSGDLRLVTSNHGEPMPGAQWIKGGKPQPLTSLDLDVNSPLIFTDLGIYTTLGTLCDNVTY